MIHSPCVPQEGFWEPQLAAAPGGEGATQPCPGTNRIHRIRCSSGFHQGWSAATRSTTGPWSAGLVWGDASTSTKRGEKHKSIEYTCKYLTWAHIRSIPSLSARGCVTPVLPPCRWRPLIHARRGRGAVSAVAASKRSLQGASSSVVTCRQPGTQVSAAVVSNW